MNQKLKKTIIRISCFFLILWVVLWNANNILKMKYGDGIYSLTKFYELEDNTTDVLILGSSHAFESFNTGVLWDEYGIASYVLGGMAQPMWNTYYYLKEALKTQTPELIVLEAYTVTFTPEDIKDSIIIKNNYGLHWSKDKIDSIKLSAPKERWAEFLLEYTQYHKRYTELSAADFFRNQNDRECDDWKGFTCNMVTVPFEAEDMQGITERAALNEKSEQYYRATIELAQENDIPIIVIVSPYPGIIESDQRIFNSAGDIAAEYGVPFVNCNLLLDEIGLDYSKDASDVDHLNYIGNQKFTRFIGSYIKERFDISNRKGNIDYKSWESHAAYINHIIEDQYLKETYDLRQIEERLQSPDYWLFVAIEGNCTASDENLQNFYKALGIPTDVLSGIGYHSASGWEWYSQTDIERYIRTEHDFCIRRNVNEDGAYTNSIIIDNTLYQKVTNGINIVVYDTVTEKIADVIGIDMDDGYNIKR